MYTVLNIFLPLRPEEYKQLHLDQVHQFNQALFWKTDMRGPYHIKSIPKWLNSLEIFLNTSNLKWLNSFRNTKNTIFGNTVHKIEGVTEKYPHMKLFKWVPTTKKKKRGRAPLLAPQELYVQYDRTVLIIQTLNEWMNEWNVY